MAYNFFENFPNIYHSGMVSKNLLIRVRFLEAITKNEYIFLPYEVRDGERPDTIAHGYYGDSRYAWVVCLSNDIIDPYYDWYLNTFEFDSYIEKKYGNTSISGYQQATTQVLHYQNNWAAQADSTISVGVYEALPKARKKYWEPIVSNRTPVGYERKRADWKITSGSYNNLYSDAANSSGTVSVSNTSTLVTGTATSFSNTFSNGTFIKVWANSSSYALTEIKTVSNNTSMTLVSNSTISNTAANYSTASGTSIENVYYSPVYAYDYEIEQNEKKKNIKLLSKVYLNQIEKELRETING